MRESKLMYDVYLVSIQMCDFHAKPHQGISQCYGNVCVKIITSSFKNWMSEIRQLF